MDRWLGVRGNNWLSTFDRIERLGLVLLPYAGLLCVSPSHCSTLKTLKYPISEICSVSISLVSVFSLVGLIHFLNATGFPVPSRSTLLWVLSAPNMYNYNTR